MNCTKCGSDNYPEAKFCRKCGASLDEQQKLAAIAEEERRKLATEEEKRLAQERKEQQERSAKERQRRFRLLRDVLWGSVMRKAVTVTFLVVGCGALLYWKISTMPPSSSQVRDELARRVAAESDNGVRLDTFNVTSSGEWNKADGKVHYFVVDYEASVVAVGNKATLGGRTYKAGDHDSFSGLIAFASGEAVDGSDHGWRPYDGKCIMMTYAGGNDKRLQCNDQLRQAPTASNSIYMTVLLKDGTSVRTPDFLHDGKAQSLSNITGVKEHYLLAGSCVLGAQGCRIGPSGNFQLNYYGGEGTFAVSIGEPLAQSREAAEQFLSALLFAQLDFMRPDLCKVKHSVLTSIYDDYSYAGRELEFSFCPGAVNLPTAPSNRHATPRAG